MTAAVMLEVPAYAAMTSPRQRQAVHEHSIEHVQAVIRAIDSWTLPTPEELAFVKARAAMRVTQHLPLSALLHAYRLGHRTVWECLVRSVAEFDNALDASVALTTLTLSYTELISAAIAEGYVDEQRSIFAQLDRARRDLLDTILQGNPDVGAETLELASSFALVPASDCLVVVMHHVADTERPPAEVETRAAEALKRHLALGVAQPFVVIRHGEVVSISPVARARPTAIAHLVRLAHAELSRAGEHWAVGISTVCAGLGEVARGYQEARQAFGSVSRSASVRALLEVRVNEYLLEHADGTALRMIPSDARRLLESKAAAERLLVDTLEAYGRADMSMRDTADALSVHPNTVAYRLEKLGRVLGRDLSRYSEVVEVLTWVGVLRAAERL